jgi:integrase
VDKLAVVRRGRELEIALLKSQILEMFRIQIGHSSAAEKCPSSGWPSRASELGAGTQSRVRNRSPGVLPTGHDHRHTFASVLLARGVPLT